MNGLAFAIRIFPRRFLGQHTVYRQRRVTRQDLLDLQTLLLRKGFGQCGDIQSRIECDIHDLRQLAFELNYPAIPEILPGVP